MAGFSWRWKRRADGEPLTKVRAEWTFTREDLANILAAAIVPSTYDDLRVMTKREMEEAIRDKLADNASARFWWRDNYENYDGEPTDDEVFEWARREAARL